MSVQTAALLFLGVIAVAFLLRGCIERLNTGILFSEPRCHEPDTARRMSDTDLGKGEASFLQQKQERDVHILPERSPSPHIEEMCFPEEIR